MTFPPKSFADMSPVALSVIWNQLILGVAIIDDRGRFVSANDAFCKILEYTSSEISGLRLDDLMSPHDLGNMLRELDEVDMGVRERHDLRYVFRGRVEAQVPVELVATKIHVDSGSYSVFLIQATPEDEADTILHRINETLNENREVDDVVVAFIRKHMGIILSAVGVSLSAFAAAIYYLARQ